MVKVKTSELQGAALDYAVAVAHGWMDFEDMAFCSNEGDFTSYLSLWSFCPGRVWAHGGPIIERERIQFRSEQNTQYRAFISQFGADAVGETHLIAAMRCYVASKLGDVVDIPDELI